MIRHHPRPHPRSPARPELKLVPLHDPDCPCCRPAPGPADDALASADRIAVACLLGLALGLLLAKAIDWLVDGPGVLAMFGAWS